MAKEFDTATMAGVRVAVNVPDPFNPQERSTRVELELPATAQIDSLIPSLRSFLIDQLESEGKSTKWLKSTDGRLRLATPANLEPLAGTDTLNTAEVCSGHELWLIRETRDRPFLPIQDDIAAGVAAAEVRHWQNQDSQALGVLMSAVLLPLTALAMAAAGSMSSTTVRYPALGGSILAAVVCATVATMLSRGLSGSAARTSGMESLTTMLTSSAYAFVAAGAWLAIPRSPGVYHALAVTAALTAAAALLRSLIDEPVWLHHAVLTPSALTALLLAVHTHWPQSPAVVCAQLIAVNVIGLTVAHRVAQLFGRIKHERVPSSTEDLVIQTGESKFSLPQTSSGNIKAALDSIAEQDARISTTHRIRYGIIGGLCAYTVIEMALLGWFSRDMSWSIWAMAALAGGVLFIRGNSDMHWVAAATMLSASVIGWSGFLIALGIAPREAPGPQLMQAGVGAALLIGAVLWATTWSVQSRELTSHLIRKVLQYGEVVAITALIVDTFLVSGGWSSIRYR